jgi:glycosyltransferase involved in cell wall biosynthesis
MPPLVSVVIAVHDGELYLREAISSVVSQDYRPLEVVVVDNGSTDSSGAIAASFADPVRVVRREGRLPAEGRNRGILESRGEYIAFLDADDRYRPGKLAAQVALLERDPEAAVCLCTVESFWEPGLEAERDRYLAAGKVRATHTFDGMLARREVFDEVGLLRTSTRHGDQVEWFLRATDAGVSTIVMEAVLVDRRMHERSLSHTSGDVVDAWMDLVAGRIAQARTS